MSTFARVPVANCPLILWEISPVFTLELQIQLMTCLFLQAPSRAADCLPTTGCQGKEYFSTGNWRLLAPVSSQ